MLLIVVALAGCIATPLPQAPEFDPAAHWLNTEKPLSLKALHGKHVLLDFWTFSCINCFHSVPEIKKLEEKYGDSLVVVGVHSPKFPNEKADSAITAAIDRYGIKNPVVNDADLKTWNAYAIDAWPTFVLINPEGKRVGQISGEGHYDVIDGQLSKLIPASARHTPSLSSSSSSSSPSLPKNAADDTLRYPSKVAVDPVGKRIFIADSGNNRIVVTDPHGEIQDVIGDGKPGTADGAFSSSEFNYPQGLAFDNGILYVADTRNNRIRRVDFAQKRVTTVIAADKYPTGSNCPLARLDSPWDILVLQNRLWIANGGAHNISVLDLKTEKIAPFIGSGTELLEDGVGEKASLAQPAGITSDGKNIYFVDSETSSVRFADPNTGDVHTMLGLGLSVSGDDDGDCIEATMQHPSGIVFVNGKLYVADTFNHKIRVVDLDKHKCTTLSGTCHSGFKDGKPAAFAEPSGIAAMERKLYVADTNNHAVRVVDIDSGNCATMKLHSSHKVISHAG